jgi:hypothetical protein
VGQVDLITDCSEFSKLGELLDDPLSQKADWDINHEFRYIFWTLISKANFSRRENIRLFIQSDKEEIIREVFFEDHFCEVLSFSTIKNLLPIIQVFFLLVFLLTDLPSI